MSDRTDYWRLADTVIDHHAGAESTHTVGEGYTLQVWLTSRSNSDDGSWPDAVERYGALRQYRPHAGAYASGVDANNRSWYREQHSTGPSLLVSLQPPSDSLIGEGGWFLVEAVEDKTTLPESVCMLDFDLLFLAPLERFDTAQAARNAMEADGL